MKKEKLIELISRSNFLTREQKVSWSRATEVMDDIIFTSYIRAFSHPDANIKDRLQKNSHLIESMLKIGNPNLVQSTIGDNGFSLLSDIKFYNGLTSNKLDLNNKIDTASYMDESNKSAMKQLSEYLNDAQVLSMQAFLKKVELMPGGDIVKQPLIMSFVGLPASFEHIDKSMASKMIDQILEPMHTNLPKPKDGEYAPDKLLYEAAQFNETNHGIPLH